MTTRAPVNAALQFLELYYPIHYQAGIGVEDALRGAELSRHQVAILWLIHAQGSDGLRMNRKAIAQALGSWFEISNAAITKAIRGMAAPRLGLVELREDPASGREQVVTLTARGEAHIAEMMQRGTRYIERIIADMTDAEIVNGIAFFTRIRDIVGSWGEKPGEG
ncbi:MAG: MarR family winged helix-turn-helix transcriptional regulator [Gammaproteobacteria bacterium]